MTAVITLDKLTKRYPGSKTLAVDELSLAINEGEVYGFLGSNGAGKSTTIRMLLNFLQPTSGSAQILGKDSVRDSVALKRDIGYLAGDVALPGRVTGKELLGYLARLQGSVDPPYMQMLAQRFQTELHKPIDQLSKGNRQKIGIVQAFMHQPSVLILDEPTSGLDPVMQERFLDTVQEAKQRGAAVFLSSHDLGEVQRMCDRVAIIRDGKLVHEGGLKEFTNITPILEVTFRGKVPAALEHTKTLEVLSTQGQTVSVRPREDIASTLAVLGTYDIVGLRTSQQELEAEFMSYYEEKN